MSVDEATLRSKSLWLDQLDEPIEFRAPLDGDIDVDVAIAGGGYTGLWTAYSLLKSDPALRVLVIEREAVGFGASGRNGGWCVGEMAGELERAIDLGGRDAGIRMTRAVMDTVDEIGRVVAAEKIGCGFAKGGVIRLARSAPQLERQTEWLKDMRAHGFTDDDVRALDAAEATARVAATGVLGGVHFVHASRIQPAHLVRGLAEVVERLGGVIVEGTAVTELVPATDTNAAVKSRAKALTDRGTVTADVVVRATEAYTRDLSGERRTLVPLYSLMVATEPLPDYVWDEIGLREMETFADDRRMVIYGQRTTDDRIAFGGRGAPYRFGSGIDAATEQAHEVHERIVGTLVELFPALEGVAITHNWGGVLGVPRDWQPSVGIDRTSGLAWAGGYVGEGVAISNLAGRTLADLITGADSDLVSLPWVQHQSRKWEPEPLRWAGINAARSLAAKADAQEAAGKKPSRLTGLVDRLIH
ncbi:MAG: FAD-dependent oxidoreductase [Actinobacteria bacterium]|nr:MAG: FAD-dependent oxidoreductase [Actinomycetota bacterium]